MDRRIGVLRTPSASSRCSWLLLLLLLCLLLLTLAMLNDVIAFEGWVWLPVQHAWIRRRLYRPARCWRCRVVGKSHFTTEEQPTSGLSINVVACCSCFSADVRSSSNDVIVFVGQGSTVPRFLGVCVASNSGRTCAGAHLRPVRGCYRPRATAAGGCHRLLAEPKQVRPSSDIAIYVYCPGIYAP